MELNLDGLVGLTHNYAGMSFGNLAAEEHKGETSHPRAAALQGLQKMRFLHDAGLKQAVLPPLPRPCFSFLHQMGFTGSPQIGSPQAVIAQVSRQAPELLPLAYSASSMWTANAATLSPSCDTQDGKLHLTPANLATHLHRSLEAPQTAALLQQIFADSRYFVHHAPLPQHPFLGDEGAANFMRFTPSHLQTGLEVLVYGEKTRIYPARQTHAASAAIFRLHGVKNHLLLEQNPAVIDAGVFHNDVIAVANENLLFYHEKAFVGGESALDAIEKAAGFPLIRVVVRSADVSVQEAVQSYLFNSQVLTMPTGKMIILAPTESQENPRVYAVLQRIVEESTNPITAVHYFDLRESMKNGGGPACLRLRVVLTEAEYAAMHQGILFTPALHQQLEQWVVKHYRESLTLADLHDPQLALESLTAHEELLLILGLSQVG
jgi:succinylarginine dihydrolase